MTNRRTRNKPTDYMNGGTRALDIAYNEQAGALKVLGPIVGQLTHLGAAPIAAAELNAPNASILAFYNSTATTQFVQTAATAAALASSPVITTGICLRPNDYTHVAIPDGHSFVNCSSALVMMYLVVDDSTIS